jgi:hypothetical protein
MKTMQVIDAIDLKSEFDALPAIDVMVMDVNYQKPKYGQAAIVFINGDEFCVCQVTNHEKKFHVSPNDLEPGDTKTFAERLENIRTMAKDMEINEQGFLELPKDLEPMEVQHFYGKYTETLVEAIAWAKDMKQKPVEDWDKEYDVPVMP